MRVLPSSSLLPLPAARAVEALQGLGYSSIELNFYNINLEGVDSYSVFNRYLSAFQAAAELGVRVEVVHLPWESYLAPFVGRGVDAVVSELKSLVELAAEYGVRIAVVHPLPYRYVGRGRGWWFNRRMLAALSSLTEDTGVVIAVENLARESPWSRVEELASLVESIGAGNLGLCLDIGHANINSSDAALLVDDILARNVMVCAHLHDNDGVSDSHAAPGCGSVDWLQLAKMLRDKDIVGVNEVHCRASGAPQCVSQAAAAQLALQGLLGV